LQGIWSYIAHDNPVAADRIIAAIEASADMLLSFPKLGRPGRRHGTRELPVVRTPYILVYRLNGSEVQIAHVIHGARDWPQKRRRA